MGTDMVDGDGEGMETLEGVGCISYCCCWWGEVSIPWRWMGMMANAENEDNEV
jgi:hypothetical protein